MLLRKISSFLSLSLVIHYLVLYSSSCWLHCTFSTGDWSFEKWGPGDDGYIQGNSFFFLEASKASPLNVCNQRAWKLLVSPSLGCPEFWPRGNCGPLTVFCYDGGGCWFCHLKMVLLLWGRWLKSRIFPPLAVIILLCLVVLVLQLRDFCWWIILSPFFFFFLTLVLEIHSWL